MGLQGLVARRSKGLAERHLPGSRREEVSKGKRTSLSIIGYGRDGVPSLSPKIKGILPWKGRVDPEARGTENLCLIPKGHCLVTSRLENTSFLKRHRGELCSKKTLSGESYKGDACCPLLESRTQSVEEPIISRTSDSPERRGVLLSSKIWTKPYLCSGTFGKKTFHLPAHPLEEKGKIRASLPRGRRKLH